MPNKGNILITGGAGFIGSTTGDELVRRGYRVRILDNLQSDVHAGKWPKYLNPKFERQLGDVRNKKDWIKALRGIDAVYHLAAYQDQRLDFSTFFETNTVSTSLLYEIAVEKSLPIKKVVLASSQFVYGDGIYHCAHGRHESFRPEVRPLKQFIANQWDIKCPHGKPAIFTKFQESQILTPTNSYGLSKQALENISLRLGKTYDIPTTVFRYSIVQGPRQSPRNLYSGALRIFVSQALAGVPITIYEDGLETRDFVNVNDVADANVLALTEPRTDFEIFNVGGGVAYRVLDFAKLVKRITGSASEISLGAFRRTDTRHAVSDISKLKKIGWIPRRTTQESVAAYVAWFKKEGFDKLLDTKRLSSLKKGIVK